MNEIENPEWDDNKNILYIFQLSRMVMFEVLYNRLRGNKQPYFSTSAQVFTRSKMGLTRAGQCQEDVLKDFPLAYRFYKKWDKHHLHILDEETYQELLNDIAILKDAYEWDFTRSSSMSWWREVDLSKRKIKRNNINTDRF